MNNVAVVKTPLQLLNAIEAKYFLGLNNVLLVVIISEPFPEMVFRPLLRFAEWRKVEYLSGTHVFGKCDVKCLGDAVSSRVNEYIKEFNQLMTRQRFDFLFWQVGRVDNLILGGYLANYMRHIAQIIGPRKLYLVDDGTDTLRVNSLRHEKAVSGEKRSLSFLRKVKNRFREVYVDWNSRQAESVVFFSSYDIALINKDSLIKNDYSFFRSKINQSDIRNEIYFLGQPLVEDGYVSMQTYHESLKKIKDIYFDYNFLYIPHKRECKCNVDKIKKIGFNVKTFLVPIEIQFLNEMPFEVSSFFCSALDNCRIIFGEKLRIKAFKINPSKLYTGCEFVEEIYDYFGRYVGKNFEIIFL